MLARFLWCIPKSNIGSRKIGQEAPIRTEVAAAYEKNISRLLDLEPAKDQNDKPFERLITLEPAARERWFKFAQEIEDKQGDGGEYESIQDWTGKLPGAALRIAGLFQLCENFNAFPVSESTMAQAIELCKLLIPHAKAAFDAIGAPPGMDDAKYLLKHLVRKVQKGELVCKQSDLNRLGRFNRGSLERLLKALDILIERNIITGRHSLSTKKPTYIYYVNPAILE
jgi:putative DNA primase/helicase